MQCPVEVRKKRGASRIVGLKAWEAARLRSNLQCHRQGAISPFARQPLTRSDPLCVAELCLPMEATCGSSLCCLRPQSDHVPLSHLFCTSDSSGPFHWDSEPGLSFPAKPSDQISLPSINVPFEVWSLHLRTICRWAWTSCEQSETLPAFWAPCLSDGSPASG